METKELSKRLKETKEAFDVMRKAGINEEVLIIYLIYKTKLPRKKVMEMLNHQKEFYENLVNKEFLEKV